MSVRTEGDEVDTNTAGILVFGKDRDGKTVSIPVSPISLNELLDVMRDILVEIKISNKYSEITSGEIITSSDIES